MGVHLPSVASTTFRGPLPANANETAILTTPPLNLPLDNAQVIILWSTNITAGTSVTSHVFKLRRGGGTGDTLLGASVWTETIAATEVDNASGCYVDTPGIVAGQQYTLTLIQTACTVAGVFNDGCLIVLAF